MPIFLSALWIPLRGGGGGVICGYGRAVMLTFLSVNLKSQDIRTPVVRGGRHRAGIPLRAFGTARILGVIPSYTTQRLRDNKNCSSCSRRDACP